MNGQRAYLQAAGWRLVGGRWQDPDPYGAMPPIDGFRASYLMRGYPDTEPGLKAACIVERARWHEPTSQPCTIRQDWRP